MDIYQKIHTIIERVELLDYFKFQQKWNVNFYQCQLLSRLFLSDTATLQLAWSWTWTSRSFIPWSQNCNNIYTSPKYVTQSYDFSVLETKTHTYRQTGSQRQRDRHTDKQLQSPASWVKKLEESGSCNFPTDSRKFLTAKLVPRTFALNFSYCTGRRII